MDRFIRIIIIVHSSHISDFSKVFEKKKKKKTAKEEQEGDIPHGSPIFVFLDHVYRVHIAGYVLSEFEVYCSTSAAFLLLSTRLFYLE